MFHSALTSEFPQDHRIKHFSETQLTFKERLAHFKESHDYLSASIWEQFLHGLCKHSACSKYSVYAITLLNCVSDVAYLGIP